MLSFRGLTVTQTCALVVNVSVRAQTPNGLRKGGTFRQLGYAAQ